jgi:hypothetical protein
MSPSEGGEQAKKRSEALGADWERSRAGVISRRGVRQDLARPRQGGAARTPTGLAPNTTGQENGNSTEVLTSSWSPGLVRVSRGKDVGSRANFSRIGVQEERGAPWPRFASRARSRRATRSDRLSRPWSAAPCATSQGRGMCSSVRRSGSRGGSSCSTGSGVVSSEPSSSIHPRPPRRSRRRCSKPCGERRSEEGTGRAEIRADGIGHRATALVRDVRSRRAVEGRGVTGPSRQVLRRFEPV